MALLVAGQHQNSEDEEQFNVEDWEFSMVQCEDLGPMQEMAAVNNIVTPAPAPHPVEVSLYQTKPPPPTNMPECTAEMWSKMMVMLRAYEAEKVQSSHQSPKSSKGSVEQVATYEPTALYIL